MARKYDQIDERLLNFLREASTSVTTADAITALAIKCGTTQRHISRRFTLLEDCGALVCTLKGTTRICTVQPDRLPVAMHKGGPNNRTWRTKIQKQIVEVSGVSSPPPSSSHPSIPAANSDEFLAAGGHVERLPSAWDNPAPKTALGPLTFLDHISELD